MVVIYLQPTGTPTEYKLLGPEEAVETLVAIEFLRDHAQPTADTLKVLEQLRDHARPADMTGPAEQPDPANPQEGERDVRE